MNAPMMPSIPQGDITAHNDYINDLNKSLDPRSMTGEQLWHHERRLGIGGSDVAAILGISRWATPLDIFNQKRGYVEPADLSTNERVHFGNVLEDVVAQEYARRFNCKVQRRNNPIVHDDLPWMRANLDRVVVGQKKVLECKTADAFTVKFNWGESGTDEVPDQYLVQCMHYLICTGWEEADLAVLIGGNRFERYCIQFDPELVAILLERVRDFWINYVLADVPPPPTTLDEINQAYPNDDGEKTIATIEVAEAINERKELDEQKGLIESRIKAQDEIIKGYMGTKNTLVDHLGQPLATWKTAKPSRRFNTSGFQKVHPDLYSEFTQEGKTSRRFLIK
ncbi:YqaJ viral recombinase family protein [Neptunomonas sp.]|uniref:YqaJ viral recombinase family nuclease n=1 Tax=Neptunomonas TaxID=75687 RepID=UPI003515D0BE